MKSSATGVVRSETGSERMNFSTESSVSFAPSAGQSRGGMRRSACTAAPRSSPERYFATAGKASASCPRTAASANIAALRTTRSGDPEPTLNSAFSFGVGVFGDW